MSIQVGLIQLHTHKANIHTSAVLADLLLVRTKVLSVMPELVEPV